MKATVGDHLVIKGHRIHEPDREAEILEVRGSSGEPPYRIRWQDTGRETLVYPGTDARIEPAPTEAVGGPTPDSPAIVELGHPARGEDGDPTLTRSEVIELVRHHLDLEKVRSADYDAELWAMWRDEVDRAGIADHNADVLDRILARIRAGE
jgi:hypothetical protein